MIDKRPHLSRKKLPDFSAYAEGWPDYSSETLASNNSIASWRKAAFVVAVPFIFLFLIAILLVVLTVTFLGKAMGLIEKDPGAYQYGTRPVPTDEEEYNREIDRLLEQANQGDTCAQMELGALYEAGFAHSRNYPEALRWYRAAASRGDPEALFKLGTMYEFGFGVQRDEVQALMWCELAHEFQYITHYHEDHSLTEQIDRVAARLKAKMTDSDIEEAMAMVEESFGKRREE